MANVGEIIKDFIELGYNYLLTHNKYVAEMKENEHTIAIANSPGHEAQLKLNLLHNLNKNGELPVKPVVAKVKDEVKGIEKSEEPTKVDMDGLKKELEKLRTKEAEKLKVEGGVFGKFENQKEENKEKGDGQQNNS
jgi:hypothetical protein